VRSLGKVRLRDEGSVGAGKAEFLGREGGVLEVGATRKANANDSDNSGPWAANNLFLLVVSGVLGSRD
jgi:hypothetical protein